MARYPIYASDYGQIGQLLASDEARQQQSSEVATGRLIDQLNANRRQQLSDREMALRENQNQMNERYLNWQMQGNGRRPTQIDNALFGEALEYTQTHGVVPEGIPPEFAAELAPIAKQVRPELAKNFELVSGAANLVNRRTLLKNAIARLEKDIATVPGRGASIMPWPFNDSKKSGLVSKEAKETTRRLTALRDMAMRELESLEPRVKELSGHKDLMGQLTFNPNTRSVMPAYIPRFMDTNSAPGRTSTATRVPPVDSQLGAPSPYGDEMIPPRGAPAGAVPPPSPSRRMPGRTVIQNGQQFEVFPDGTSRYIGPAQ